MAGTLVMHRKRDGALLGGNTLGELLPAGMRILSTKILYQFFDEVMHPSHTKHCFLAWLTSDYCRSLADMAGVPQSKLPELREHYTIARPHTSTHWDTVCAEHPTGDYIIKIANGFVVDIKDHNGLSYEPIAPLVKDKGGLTPDLTYYHFLSGFKKYDLEVL